MDTTPMQRDDEIRADLGDEEYFHRLEVEENDREWMDR